MKPLLFFSQTTPRPVSTKTLNEIFIQHELDKSRADEHDFGWHKSYPYCHCNGYSTFYGPKLEPLRHSPIRMLEIGICTQLFPFGSVKAWLDYFPYAEVWGMDNFGIGSYPAGSDEALLEKAPLLHPLLDRGLSFIFGDMGDKDCVQEAKNQLISASITKFDFIIDDGSHISKDTLTSLDIFWDMIVPGGFYAIEDLATAWPEPQGSLMHGNNYEVLWALKSMYDPTPELYPYSDQCLDVIPRVVKSLEGVGLGLSLDHANWIAFLTKKTK